MDLARWGRIGVAEVYRSGPEAVRLLLQNLCTTVDCDKLATSLSGQNCCLNETTLAKFVQNGYPQSEPDTRTGVLSKYDYGNVYENMFYYSSPEPPVYDLSKIPPDFPLFISYGGQDALADVEDVNILLEILKLLVYKHIIDFFRKHN
ncbi:lipase [Striga asiatica]|uniref:Lipase n=1 Tax=Striga asiatica TaxID=4170 RepID=A0A5A7PL53_STRAF|nr:lipase [Striga asiatica]